MPDKQRLSKQTVGHHIGTNALLPDHLVWDCAGFLLNALRKLKAFLKRPYQEHAAPLVILCACDWGKHRSVSMDWVLESMGHDTIVRHMNRHQWSCRYSCGLPPCNVCDKHNYE